MNKICSIKDNNNTNLINCFKTLLARQIRQPKFIVGHTIIYLFEE